MGCDIHLFCETREPGGPWVLTPVIWDCVACNSTGKMQSHKEGEGMIDCYVCNGTKQVTGYSQRNYNLFAILANVRNGFGFAGIPTGEGFVPISEPRGLPKDMSEDLVMLANSEYAKNSHEIWKEFTKKYGAGWLGDHSWSWITLAELLLNDWDQNTVHRGQVMPATWIEWKDSGDNSPQQWTGAHWGKGVRVISEVAAFALKECLKVEDGKCVLKGGLTERAKYALLADQSVDPSPLALKEEKFKITLDEFDKWLNGSQKCEKDNIILVVESSWQTSYKDSVYSFYTHFMPALVALGKGPENTRIVFGFDS